MIGAGQYDGFRASYHGGTGAKPRRRGLGSHREPGSGLRRDVGRGALLGQRGYLNLAGAFDGSIDLEGGVITGGGSDIFLASCWR